MKHKHIIRISAVIISVVLVALLLSQISIGGIAQTLVSVGLIYLAISFVLYAFIYLFRALRFRILLGNKVSLRELFPIVCVHNMVNSILPARTGEVSYVYLTRKLHNVSVGEGIASLMVARVFDLISVSLLFFISALMIQDLPAIFANAVWAIVSLMVVFVVLLIVLLYFGESLLNLVRKFLQRLNLEKKRFIGYLLRKGEETVESLSIIKSTGKIIETIAVSIGIWLCLYSSNYILVTAMDIELSFFAVLLGSTFALLTTILPIQGIVGMGTIEGGWTLGFMGLGLTKEAAITSGFGIHIIVICYFLILGCLGLLTIRRKKPI